MCHWISARSWHKVGDSSRVSLGVFRKTDLGMNWEVPWLRFWLLDDSDATFSASAKETSIKLEHIELLLKYRLFVSPYLVGGISLLTIETDSGQFQNVPLESEDVYVVASRKSRMIPKILRKLAMDQEELPAAGGKECLLEEWIVAQIKELRSIHAEKESDTWQFPGILKHLDQDWGGIFQWIPWVNWVWSLRQEIPGFFLEDSGEKRAISMEILQNDFLQDCLQIFFL